MQTIQTSWGCFLARYSQQGLRSLEFPGDPMSQGALEGAPSEGEWISREWFKLTEDALHRALSGKVPSKMPPMDLRQGTPFQRKVWSFLMEIPMGEVKTYLDVALGIGHPRASRAVGNGCGANPIPVLIPCHRVVGSGGGLGGFTAGLEWKERLLSLEGGDFLARI